MKEEVEELKEKFEEVKEYSVAFEILKDERKQNNKQSKRQFIIILVMIGLLVLETTYLFYLKDDINTSSDTIEIEDVENINSSTIKIGDEYGENKNN